METALLEQLIADHGLQNCNLLLCGDGSGSKAELPCGWAYTLYDRATKRVLEHWGGASGGTNNYAELAPYLHALWFYHVSTFGNGELQVQPSVRVGVISDSEITVRCGNGEYARRANAGLWAQLNWYEKNGYRFKWIHVPRNSTPFHSRADRTANVARKQLLEMQRCVKDPAPRPSAANGRRPPTSMMPPRGSTSPAAT